MSGRLELSGITTAYGKADVLNGVSLTVEPGRITCLLGSNGSGKTTLIRSILGLTPPRAGQVRFDGTDITGFSTHRIVAAGIACIPEGRKVFPKLTVAENLRIGAYQERSADAIASRFEDIYRLFPRLAERRRNLGNQLSGGEQQMLAVGRALVLNPRVMLLDEPLEGLAPILVEELLAALTRIIRDEGTAAILVEQNAHKVLAVTDRAAILERGAIVHEGRSSDLLAERAVLDSHLGITAAGSRRAGARRP